jgi:hypothetical protein
MRELGPYDMDLPIGEQWYVSQTGVDQPRTPTLQNRVPRMIRRAEHCIEAQIRLRCEQIGDIRSFPSTECWGLASVKCQFSASYDVINVKDSVASHRYDPAGELSLIYSVIGTIHEASHAGSVERHIS